MRPLARLVALAVLPVACSRASSPGASGAVESGSSGASPPAVVASAFPPAVASVAPSATAAPSASVSAGVTPALVYARYGNPRFGFSVDVPTFFAASPPPTNGDGQEWTWGGRATMTASGMNAMGMTTKEGCAGDAKRKGMTAHSLTATDCWVTGRDGGRIFWEKTQLAGDVVYSLRFDYEERLKDAFDPLVAHVNASWRVPKSEPPSASAAPKAAPASTCPKGWIDECGGCYPRCEADRDCKTKGQTCQPIVCAHGSYGNGCL
jgi:hypothetical protein